MPPSSFFPPPFLLLSLLFPPLHVFFPFSQEGDEERKEGGKRERELTDRLILLGGRNEAQRATPWFGVADLRGM